MTTEQKTMKILGLLLCSFLLVGCVAAAEVVETPKLPDAPKQQVRQRRHCCSGGRLCVRARPCDRSTATDHKRHRAMGAKGILSALVCRDGTIRDDKCRAVLANPRGAQALEALSIAPDCGHSLGRAAAAAGVAPAVSRGNSPSGRCLGHGRFLRS